MHSVSNLLQIQPVHCFLLPIPISAVIPFCCKMHPLILGDSSRCASVCVHCGNGDCLMPPSALPLQLAVAACASTAANVQQTILLELCSAAGALGGCDTAQQAPVAAQLPTPARYICQGVLVHYDYPACPLLSALAAPRGQVAAWAQASRHLGASWLQASAASPLCFTSGGPWSLSSPGALM